MTAQSFIDYLVNLLSKTGIDGAESIRAISDAKNFGDAEAIFRVGPLVLRFLRDRSQEFLELATNVAPDKFYQFGDVEIAMGWKTIDEVLAKRELEPLSSVLARLHEHRAEMSEALSSDRESLTRARIERAAQERGKAFVERLHEKK